MFYEIRKAFLFFIIGFNKEANRTYDQGAIFLEKLSARKVEG
jgi:hypothetical protein